MPKETITVAELIDALSSLPQDALVQCLFERTSGYSVAAAWKPLELPFDVFFRSDENIVQIGDL